MQSCTCLSETAMQNSNKQTQRVPMIAMTCYWKFLEEKIGDCFLSVGDFGTICLSPIFCQQQQLECVSWRQSSYPTHLKTPTIELQ